MGDRTSVELTIFKSDSDLFKKVIGEDNLADFTDSGLHEATIDLKYDDVSYAELGFEKSLQEAKIPYIKTWEDGGDYSAGYDVFRVNADGSTSIKTFDDFSTFVPLMDLEKALEKGIDAVQALADEKKKENEYMSWEDQGKIIQAIRKA